MRLTQTIPSRPTTLPDRDYVVSAPTDCIMNPLVQVLDAGGEIGQVRALIDNPLTANTIIDVKSYPIALNQLLGNAPESLKQKFVGGTGVACVLMPNTYHHFHTPVTGEVVHAEVVEIGSNGALGTYGYFDWPNWVPREGNVGQPGTDFSQFEVFQRGVVIIKISYAGAEPGEVLEGYVASIPVGLDTIGSVVLDSDIVPGAQVKRGYTRLGNFYYGGSLNILLFSKGIASPAIQVRLGNQIAILNAGNAPGVTTDLIPGLRWGSACALSLFIHGFGKGVQFVDRSDPHHLDSDRFRFVHIGADRGHPVLFGVPQGLEHGACADGFAKSGNGMFQLSHLLFDLTFGGEPEVLP